MWSGPLAAREPKAEHARGMGEAPAAGGERPRSGRHNRGCAPMAPFTPAPHRRTLHARLGSGLSACTLGQVRSRVSPRIGGHSHVVRAGEARVFAASPARRASAHHALLGVSTSVRHPTPTCAWLPCTSGGEARAAGVTPRTACGRGPGDPPHRAPGSRTPRAAGADRAVRPRQIPNPGCVPVPPFTSAPRRRHQLTAACTPGVRSITAKHAGTARYARRHARTRRHLRAWPDGAALR
jgi:hypothetical protein